MQGVKLPAEIHTAKGSRGNNQGVLIDERLKNRIPVAEWLANPEEFSKEKFIHETSQWLWDTYRIGTDQDRHTLAMLADQMAIYMEAKRLMPTMPLVVEINDGKTLAPNPYIALANKSMDNSIKLMTELGLTPKSRLAKGKDDVAPLASFLAGPKAA